MLKHLSFLMLPLLALPVCSFGAFHIYCTGDRGKTVSFDIHPKRQLQVQGKQFSFIEPRNISGEYKANGFMYAYHFTKENKIQVEQEISELLTECIKHLGLVHGSLLEEIRITNTDFFTSSLDSIRMPKVFGPAGYPVFFRESDGVYHRLNEKYFSTLFYFHPRLRAVFYPEEGLPALLPSQQEEAGNGGI